MKRYTSHCFSGDTSSSEDLTGRLKGIYLETNISCESISEDIEIDTLTGRVKMDIDIPSSVFGKVKIFKDMGRYMTSAVEPLNGAVAIAGAKALLDPIMSDMIGICDIKCESNPNGGNDDSVDYRTYKKLEAVMVELTELTAEFVRVNNEE